MENQDRLNKEQWETHLTDLKPVSMLLTCLWLALHWQLLWWAQRKECLTCSGSRESDAGYPDFINLSYILQETVLRAAELASCIEGRSPLRGSCCEQSSLGWREWQPTTWRPLFSSYSFWSLPLLLQRMCGLKVSMLHPSSWDLAFAKTCRNSYWGIGWEGKWQLKKLCCFSVWGWSITQSGLFHFSPTFPSS